MRLVLGNHDLVLGAGEAAEFDTRVPHWFGSAGEQPAEILSMFGPRASARTPERRLSARKRQRDERGVNRLLRERGRSSVAASCRVTASRG